MEEKIERCSRCHLDMNKSEDTGGCTCCKEHSQKSAKKTPHIPDPDALLDEDSDAYNLINFLIVEEEE